MEEWRTIPSLSGYYEASSLGRIRRARPGHATFIGRIIRSASHRRGYRYVCVPPSPGAKLRSCYVHALVAEAFLGPCPLGMQVNHRDLVKTNNVPINLEYVTPQENMEHARIAGRLWHPVGSASPSAKLTEVDIPKIRHLHREGVSQRKIARLFGVQCATITAILLGRTWRHVA